MVVGTEASDRCLNLEEAITQELLPGIPDEIPAFLLSPKISWRDIRLLSSVSSEWLRAVRRRQFYDARVRSKATETLVLVTYPRIIRSKKVTAMAAYSVRGNYCIELPPIPYLGDGGIPRHSQFVSLNGKVYVLGGVRDDGVFTGDCDYHDFNSDKVFVLDLAGQRQWKQCASMRAPRHRFGCGVVDRKIYVFGGTLGFGPRSGSEVYDPNTDTWSPIQPMSALRCNHRVVIIREELVVYDGHVCDLTDEAVRMRDWPRTKLRAAFSDSGDLEPDNEYCFEDWYYSRSRVFDEFLLSANSLEIYNPVRDEWRVVQDFRIMSNPPHNFALFGHEEKSLC